MHILTKLRDIKFVLSYWRRYNLAADSTYGIGCRLKTDTHDPVRRTYGTARTHVPCVSALNLWRPLLPYGYSYKASCARPG